MASVSFSVRDVVAKNLDDYMIKHKLGSRTLAIEHLLKSKVAIYDEVK